MEYERRFELLEHVHGVYRVLPLQPHVGAPEVVAELPGGDVTH